MRSACLSPTVAGRAFEMSLYFPAYSVPLVAPLGANYITELVEAGCRGLSTYNAQSLAHDHRLRLHLPYVKARFPKRGSNGRVVVVRPARQTARGPGHRLQISG
jgi:hypothetical protein